MSKDARHSRSGRRRRSLPKDRCHHRSDPVDRLHRPIADMAPKMSGDDALDHGEFAPVDLEEVAQRGDPDGIRATKGHLVQVPLAARAEHVVEWRQDAELCHEGVHPGVGRDAEGDELGTLCRRRHNLRSRTSSRSSRSSGGAIQASGQITPTESPRELGGIEHVVLVWDGLSTSRASVASRIMGKTALALHIRFLATRGTPVVRRSLSGSSGHDFPSLRSAAAPARRNPVTQKRCNASS